MPCPLEERIQSDLVTALKNKDSVKLSVLRMLKSSMQLAQTEKSRTGDLTEEELHAMIRKAIKQRDEAAEQYRAGNAPDRAADELAEAEILKAYLPAELTDDELKTIVSKAIAAVGATSAKEMGKVMGPAVQEVHGRADGKRVKDMVLKLLG